MSVYRYGNRTIRRSIYSLSAVISQGCSSQRVRNRPRPLRRPGGLRLADVAALSGAGPGHGGTKQRIGALSTATRAGRRRPPPAAAAPRGGGARHGDGRRHASEREETSSGALAGSACWPVGLMTATPQSSGSWHLIHRLYGYLKGSNI